jgi:tRNA A-37 threonylcarbamoyl transferase component Bud32
MDFSLGRSGCSFEVIDNTILRKTSKCIQENNRHVARGWKQYLFSRKVFPNLSTPIVHDINFNEDGLTYIDMDLIDGISLMDFLQNTDNFEDYLFLENTLIEYLDRRFGSCILNSSITPIESVISKVKEIGNNLSFPNKSLILNRLGNIPSNKLIIGSCHGDLTLANMIYSNRTFYLVDFLDTYIESPLLDLISLRQDTKHQWTCFINNEYNDKTLYWLKILDDKLISRYSKYIESDWYQYLSILNYVRMYRMYDTTSDAIELNFIQTSLQHYI